MFVVLGFGLLVCALLWASVFGFDNWFCLGFWCYWCFELGLFGSCGVLLFWDLLVMLKVLFVMLICWRLIVRIYLGCCLHVCGFMGLLLLCLLKDLGVCLTVWCCCYAVVYLVNLIGLAWICLLLYYCDVGLLCCYDELGLELEVGFVYLLLPVWLLVFIMFVSLWFCCWLTVLRVVLC